MKRLFDWLGSLLGLILLLPLFVILWTLVVAESRGGGFYKQARVGLKGKEFFLWKFRTMHTGSDRKGLLTVGGRDPRITRTGYFLRKYKLDELPQLLNVLVGEMSLVGPRPEVRKYVDLYTEEQRKVLEVKPGITDYASIEFSNENELLGASANPEAVYIQEIMPRKLELNLQYIQDKGLLTDIKIIFKTIAKVFG